MSKCIEIKLEDRKILVNKEKICWIEYLESDKKCSSLVIYISLDPRTIVVPIDQSQRVLEEIKEFWGLGSEMEEINDTSVLEEIEQKLDSFNQNDKLHVIGDLACGIHVFSRSDRSEEVEAIGERILNEGGQMERESAIALLKKLVNSL